MPFRLSLSLLIISLLAGCVTPATPPAPAVTPQILSVQITPALQSMRPLLAACAQQQPALGLAVSERPAAADLLPGAQMLLRLGAPQQLSGYAAEIGQEQIALVGNPANRRAEMTLAEVKSIYSGAGDGQITPWAYPAGDELQAMLEALLGATGAAAIAPGPLALREAVVSDPNAIGFLPARAVDARLRPILLRGAPEAVTRQPVLALLPAEPQGAERLFLACLQEQLKP